MGIVFFHTNLHGGIRFLCEMDHTVAFNRPVMWQRTPSLDEAPRLVAELTAR
jgi:hypothetical protein